MTTPLRILPATPSESSLIATLIMEAMNHDCCQWFCGPNHTLDEFHAFLTTLVQRTDTQYSYLNTLVAKQNDETAGILVSYDGARLLELRQPFIEGMKTHFQRDFSNLDPETQAGELYLDSLCVKSTYRHRGIATLLLQASINKTTQLHLPAAGLLVDQLNPKAEALYASLGFTTINQTSWGGHPMNHMQRKV